MRLIIEALGDGREYISEEIYQPFAARHISLLEHLSLLDNATGNLDVITGQKPDSSFEIVDISKAPHMLIAGTTGSGKTIFLYSIIVSLLYKYQILGEKIQHTERMLSIGLKRIRL